MKVVLLNNNPAVSRLISLSVNKLGYDFQEVASRDEITSNVDILVVDSEIDGFDSSLTSLANHTVFLVPKNLENIPEGGEILEKPFLPTRFIEIIESFSQNSFADVEPKEDDDIKFADFEDVMNDIEMSSSLENDLKDNLSIDEDNIKNEDIANKDIDEKLDIENLDNTKEEHGELFENEDISEVCDTQENQSVDDFKESLEKEISDINTDNVDDIDEITSIIDEIDNMGDESSDEQNLQDDMASQLKEEIPTENLEDEAIQTNEENQDDFEKSLDEVLGQDDLQEDVVETNLEEDSLKDDVNLDSGLVDENEEVGENLDEQQDDLQDNFKEDLIEDDSLSENAYEEDINLQEDEAPEFDSEEATFEDKVEDKNIEQLSNEDIQDINEITEKAMKVALNEEVVDNVENNDENINEDTNLNIHDELDIKNDSLKKDIANKISDEINSTLSQSSIREALKNMKININITFEDK
ncbi:Highly acidic protein [Campylobacter sputorum subsp. bubulus]|uniref:Highly acidic protein n=1 Tax=Campylobacter sputorum subsp. sputorum TaxID=32024 RepID=A0A381DL91_9BACT|nr:hypothetical protein [Campylobacter sputorum]ASM34728.1 hypothetical protein CSPUT_0477 [Campylobacter sputorum aubsp. sputorum RM3237]KAB0581713.1 hypothetical protein F7P64_05495 [Campylobacter sputorum subsp. sputorum]QEL04919.1 hypothetical protein CSPT_0477 [Campylobacter sputorum subsp. sputorum]SUX09998.1 Highly acidic protein [Campylobacter sputorum subsp. bubulus]SUX11405.1 Highly acidic protein [Campylobacter sputorum subsp. sputorum]